MSDCNVDASYQKAVIDIAVETARILELHSVLYWADMGTLLGAMRNSKMISHDSDVDFAYFKKDFEAVQTAFSNHSYLVLQLQNYEGRMLARIYDSRNGPINTQYPHIDLFAYWEEHDGTMYGQLVDELLVPVDLIGDPRKNKVLFEKNTFLAPEKAELYLNFRYGSDWRTNIVRRWQDCKNSITIRMWGVKV